MIYRKDNYFDRFKCIADKCPESCCIGWQIMIDDESLNKYKSDTDLADGIDFNEECFKQLNRRCSMLDENNLCYIHKTRGESALCKTCHEYPRHTEEFENEREYSLSLSCPQVVFDLLSGARTSEACVSEACVSETCVSETCVSENCVSEDGHIRILEWEDDTPDDFEEFDYMLYSRLFDAREVIFNLINDDSIKLSDKMMSILDFAATLNNLLNEGLFAEMDDAIAAFKPIIGKTEDYARSKNDFSILFSLETLHEDWPSKLEHTWNTIFSDKNPNHLWNEYLSLSPEMEKMCSKLLFSLIYTYFLGAVYDDLIYAKAAFCVNSIRYILLITKAYDKHYDFDTFVKTIYTYAREIEHSDINLDALDEAFFIP